MGLFSRRVDRQIAAYQRELIDIHYKEVDTMYRKMRGWRHDYRNHISVMKGLHQSGQFEELGRYLDMLETDLNTVDVVVKTGNPMADAILNSKLTLAAAKNVPVKTDVHIPVRLGLSELDLCVILGNLLDNAIEASQSLPEGERMVRIYMDIKETRLYISVTNLCSGKKMPKVNGRFLTKKGEGHGFGLVRIDDIVERHGGYLNRNSEDGAFTTEILLPLE
ncbi:MAG: GHKL domain-containing protein [Clostridia bacterium]|nr:GHKL domain-containing protein [Clostridia bacterium]